MKRVNDADDLAHTLDLAISEAAAAFGDPRVYLERFVAVRPACRGAGARATARAPSRSATATARSSAATRSCSRRRRRPLLPDAVRAEMARRRAAPWPSTCTIAAPGTVEFLVDRERATFYFLEMNARIQVEHPVTEAITGLDLVAEQLAVAEGQPLRIRQEDVALTGHAIECRINAEDWAHDFRPSPGRIDRRASCRSATGIRVDTHVQGGSVVPPHYDSLLGKLIVHGVDRADALARARRGAGPLRIDGVTTTVPVHQALLADAEFAAGGVDTAFFERFLRRTSRPGGGALMADVGLVDVSLRDGNQSLWGATGLRTGAHRCRLRRCWTGSASARWTTPPAPHMGVAVRTHRENPWERIRLTRAADADARSCSSSAPASASSPGRTPIPSPCSWSTTGWSPTASTASSSSTRCTTWTPPARPRRRLKQAGVDEVIGALTFTISAVHDDAFYADLAGRWPRARTSTGSTSRIRRAS